MSPDQMIRDMIRKVEANAGRKPVPTVEEAVEILRPLFANGRGTTPSLFARRATSLKRRAMKQIRLRRFH